MKCFKYWARGKSTDSTHMPASSIVSFGFSNVSLDDALRVAEERANRIAARVASASPIEQYDYLAGPLREEVIEELAYDGNLEAAITRNAYGALILNTAHVLFADIDLPHPPFFEWFLSLFRKKPDSVTQKLLEKIDHLCVSQPGLGIRLYRTKAGYRAIVTSQCIEPNSGQATELLRALGSDELYMKLCRTQESFRARLTPKPWRIDMERPPCRYPFASQKQKDQMQRWLDEYERKSKPVVACASRPIWKRSGTRECGTGFESPRPVRMRSKRTTGLSRVAPIPSACRGHQAKQLKTLAVRIEDLE